IVLCILFVSIVYHIIESSWDWGNKEEKVKKQFLDKVNSDIKQSIKNGEKEEHNRKCELHYRSRITCFNKGGNYSYDIKKTDSIISPFVATLE
ncbi:MAG TPA: hypothetical protein DCP92_09855, partial [Nitrospiraceae bacterium]|nr:hypothetical protein [Nitrospiraceae bacterium]